MPLDLNSLEKAVNSLEKALKRFKKKFERTGVLKEIRSRDGKTFTGILGTKAMIDVLQEEGETIGYVYFDNFDKRVSLFMLNDKYDKLFGQKAMVLGDVSVYCGTCTGMSYVLWKNGDVVCVLVGDLPESSLMGLAENFI